MNVYEKLNEARIKFQNANVKKSGQNKLSTGERRSIM